MSTKRENKKQPDWIIRKQKLRAEAAQLPVSQARIEIMKHINENQTLVVVGETGSGKTTQIPQFLYDAGFTKSGMIAITQPRRVAAISIANRVAQEMGTKLGSKVGYSIRFDDMTSPSTVIKFVTDGMLLRELLSDNTLSRYSVIVLDEAHERTLRTDILFGMIKNIQQKRPDLKVIIMSATLNAEKFSSFFNVAKILYIEGRMFPVRTFHTETKLDDYLDSALVSVMQIHQEEPEGDMLVFLTGQEEIESAEKLLNDSATFLPPECPKLIVCPIFASMPTHQQQKVFEPAPPGTRKVILSTNIAETSITINGIRYVIDTGMVKVRAFNPNIGLETLTVNPISKASADQRRGRAGREAPGCCYRLYTIESFKKLETEPEPEIGRVNLASVVLLLKASGVEDVVHFPYMDKPSKPALLKALEELYALGALNDDGKLSEIGKQMSEFPLDPPFSKMLIKSKEYKCTKEIIDIIAMLSVDSIFFFPQDKREEATASMKKFLNYQGDHLTLLNVLHTCQTMKSDPEFYKENFIKKRSISQVLEIKKQLQQLCDKLNIDTTVSSETNQDVILKCLLSGFFMNVAFLQGDGTYKTLLSNQIVHIHPSSVLFGRKCPAVLFNELVHTSRKYMRKLSMIERHWLAEVAPHYYGRKSL